MKRAFILILAFAALASAQSLSQRHQEMLYPVVRVRSGSVGGSGTTVYSKKDTAGNWRTFVMTNHHVIENQIEVKERWDPVLKKETKSEITKTVYVEFFRYNNLSHVVGSFAVEADIATYDVLQDWALLELRDKENEAPAIARLFPRDKIEDEIHVLDEVYAVGASLGHAPIVTKGEITYLDDEIDNYKFGMSTAQIIYGNSGGAMFRWSKERKHYEFIGIPSRISVSLSGFSSTPIPHLGYFIGIDRLYNMLDEHMFRFLYDNKITIEQEDKDRTQKQEKARLGER